MVENISQTIFFVKPKDVRRGSEIYGYLFEKLAGSSLVVAERKFTSLPYEAWMGFYSHLERKIS
jgi:nucleoside diphosphate kinase